MVSSNLRRSNRRRLSPGWPRTGLVPILALLSVAIASTPALAWRFTHVGVDSSGGQPGQFCSLVKGSNGRLHASYFRFSSDDGGKNLAYATRPSSTSGAWTRVTVDGGSQVGTYSSISLERNGNPHIAYYESEFANLKHAWYDSSMATWRTELVDNIGTVGLYTSIAMDTTTGAVNILYHDATKPGLKWARKPVGGLWSFSYVDTTGVSGLYASAIFTGILEVAYYDLLFGSLRYARQSGNGWTIENVDTPGDVGRFASMSPIDGRRIITYYDVTNQQLKVAESFGTNSWTKTVIDNVGAPGQGASIAVGPGQRPAITYYVGATQDLKYAERINGVWLRDTIASGGDVGRYNALVVDAENLPALLYYDGTQGKLRSATGRAGTTGVPEPTPAPDVSGLPAVKAQTNPFRDACTFTLRLPVPGRVSLDVFDTTGRRLRRIEEGHHDQGPSSLVWDGRDDAGRDVGNGLYFLRVSTPSGVATTRVTRIR